MPRYYCDYCDTYLTHDSPSVRKQHNSGYKHKANIRSYYQKFEEQQTQILLDQKIKQHLGQTAAYQQIGSAYNQHLAAFPGGRPPMHLIPPPMMPVPGGVPPHMAPGFRPPVLPLSVPGVPGYGPPSMATSGMMQQPPGSTMPPPPGSTMLPPPPATSLPPSTQSHEANPSGTSSATIGSYSYAQAS